MTLLAKIARRHPLDLLMAAEALLLLAFFRICLALVPVRRTIRMVARRPAGVRRSSDAGELDTLQDPPQGRGLSIARRVAWVVGAVSRNSPVEFVCFPQALAGYTMLRWRGVHSSIVYGVARSREGELIAHTWLTAGDRIVLGGEGSAAFTPVERWI